MLAILSQFIIEIIAAVIIVPLTLKYSKVLIRYIKSKRFETRMNKVYSIYVTLKELREYLGSKRILLLKTTNGGGLPSPGKVLYATIVAEVSQEGDSFGHVLRAEWQNRLIDHEYIRMLEKVYTDGSVINTVSEMPEHSMLKGQYEKIDIKQTKIIKLGIYNNAFYYLSIGCDRECHGSPAEEYTIDTAIQRLKKLLQ